MVLRHFVEAQFADHHSVHFQIGSYIIFYLPWPKTAWSLPGAVGLGSNKFYVNSFWHFDGRRFGNRRRHFRAEKL
jgi:hypothetical protein